jgi:hypothetical protein
MIANATRPSWTKRILLSIAGLFVLKVIFNVAVRVVVRETYDGGGIESSSRIPFTAGPSWDLRTMWGTSPMLQKSGLSGGAPWQSSIARTASLLTRSSAFDASLALVLGVLFEFGLPLLFWAIILFWPLRALWRRFRRTSANSPALAAP